MSLSYPTKQEERDAKAHRIVQIILKEPEIQRSVIARRFGVSDAFIVSVLQEAGLYVRRINGRAEL